MGQTLTHGIYLPDEGERNCYSGLAANWGILDGAVGTVAEHTFQIAGKAPAVHTHVKSDITDLLNSNFIPSANNSYDFGSSSYQWNNIYSKGYYYNGIPWGLDQNNTWIGNNTFQGNIYHKSGTSTLVKGTIPSSTVYYGSFRHQTYAGDEINLFRGYIGTSGDNCYRWAIEPWVSGSNGRFQMRVSSDGSVRAFEVDGTEVSPYTTNVTDLGTSTNKWKTINGINPGALSLPVTALANTYDISGDITDLTGGNNSITAARTGWIFVKSDNATEISIENTTTGMGASDHSAAAATLMVSIPVTSGETLNIIANCTSIDKAYLLPCQGNV